jgi:hypothetical protein
MLEKYLALRSMFKSGTGGGTSAKVFDFTFEDGAKLKITDLGSDIVNVFFQFVGKQTGNSFQYALPTDNAEFTAWAEGKILLFPTIPITIVGGVNAGTFYDYPALVMADIAGIQAGTPMLMVMGLGYDDDPVEGVTFNETVRILSLAEFG